MSIQMPSNPDTPEAQFNASVYGELEKDVAGGSDITLSELEAQYHTLVFSGLLTANIAVIVPSENKAWDMQNATTSTGGSWTLTVKPTGATGVAITAGKKVRLAFSTYASDVVAWTAEL